MIRDVTLLLQRQFREFQSNLGRQPSLRQEQVEQDDLDNADNEYNDDIVDIDNEEWILKMVLIKVEFVLGESGIVGNTGWSREARSTWINLSFATQLFNQHLY